MLDCCFGAMTSSSSMGKRKCDGIQSNPIYLPIQFLVANNTRLLQSQQIRLLNPSSPFSKPFFPPCPSKSSPSLLFKSSTVRISSHLIHNQSIHPSFLSSSNHHRSKQPPKQPLKPKHPKNKAKQKTQTHNDYVPPSFQSVVLCRNVTKPSNSNFDLELQPSMSLSAVGEC